MVVSNGSQRLTKEEVHIAFEGNIESSRLDRRELNPRPKKPAMQRLRVFPILFIQRRPKEPAKAITA
jgi:hypothetical protein